MSKLLTDLMAAERRRRQLAISRSTKEAPAKAGDAAFAADDALRARIEAEHLAAAKADPWKRVVLDRTASRANPLAAENAGEQHAADQATVAALARAAAAAETASAQRGPQRNWRSLFAATALALMGGHRRRALAG